MTVALCLSACSASAGWVSSPGFIAARASAQVLPPMSPVFLTRLAYPPLDPPPIV
jgi:hypothetical protein